MKFLPWYRISTLAKATFALPRMSTAPASAVQPERKSSGAVQRDNCGEDAEATFFMPAGSPDTKATAAWRATVMASLRPSELGSTGPGNIVSGPGLSSSRRAFSAAALCGEFADEETPTPREIVAGSDLGHPAQPFRLDVNQLPLRFPARGRAQPACPP